MSEGGAVLGQDFSFHGPADTINSNIQSFHPVASLNGHNFGTGFGGVADFNGVLVHGLNIERAGLCSYPPPIGGIVILRHKWQRPS